MGFAEKKKFILLCEKRKSKDIMPSSKSDLVDKKGLSSQKRSVIKLTEDYWQARSTVNPSHCLYMW